MDERNSRGNHMTYGAFSGLGFGVFWYVWGVYGFWWGVCYGIFWPIWLGYRMAQYFLAQ